MDSSNVQKSKSNSEINSTPKYNRMNIAEVLLIFYVLVASNYTDNLLGKQMKEYINNNRLIQHVIGFLTMLILVTLIGDVTDTRTAIAYALVAYLWFILSTKLDVQWNIIIIILLFIGYMYENSLGMKEKEIIEDKNLSIEQKDEMIAEQNKYKIWLIGGILLITIIGTFLYSQKKTEQYGGGYDVFTYLLY